jgi:hypothetical protein
VKSLRQLVRRLFGRSGDPQRPGHEIADPRPSDYAYTLYWAREARSWSKARRHEVAAALDNVLSDPAFQPNEFYRTHTILELDDTAHAGASLLALKGILATLEQSEPQGDSDD